MCVDSEGGLVYIFGGWDGQKDLSDFWSFNVETRQWKCISMDTRRFVSQNDSMLSYDILSE